MEELLKQRINALTPEYRDFLASGYIRESVSVFAAKEELTSDETELLETEILFYCLFFYTKDDLIAVIQSDFEMKRGDAALLTDSVLAAFPTFFHTLHENTMRYFNAAEADTAILSEEKASAPSLESDIAETEAALNAIPQMRTMMQDAEESKSHTSSQSDLLNKQNRWTPKK